ncbi:hypothetical protein LR48_Vigan277s000300 [Vigna angularis]|uniref:Homologous recombination OB-fold protein OB-fold domain-containing protein n=1 Tax=Phaseolus angularis TaxID=3914 RepID=A0A0L9T7E1_PHAAN|nr:hypothetical protein LR48_Vigan277s000300 [Vigna angularis]
MEPWEELDIDESDLDSFIRRCNSNNSVIPGLAGLLIKHEVEHISTLDSLRGTCKLSLLRCIVKACEHNELGDMKITIRDPTGTVKASVHHKAIDHPEK